MLTALLAIGCVIATGGWAVYALSRGRITVLLRTEFRTATYDGRRQPDKFWGEVGMLMFFAGSMTVAAIIGVVRLMEGN